MLSAFVRSATALVATATLLSVLTPLCSGQTADIGPDVARPIPSAGHDYIHLLSETVNPANGSLNINISLPTPKGRGFSIPFSLTYNSGQVNHFSSGLSGMGALVPDFVTSMTSGGWGDSFPYSSATFWTTQAPYVSGQVSTCEFSASYDFYDMAGGSHMLGLAGVGYPTGSSQVGSQFCLSFGNRSSITGGDDQVKAQALENCNGSQAQGQVSPPYCMWAAFDFTVTQKDGTVFSFPVNYQNTPSPSGPPVTAFFFPNTIEDRNGNIATVTASTSQNARTITDTLGRTVVSANGKPGGASTYVVGGLTYSVATTTTSANYTLPTQQVAPISANTGCIAYMTVPNPNPSASYPVPDTGHATVIKTLTLPNGQAFTFSYESTYGLLNQITYPDGGWVKYTWKLNDTMSDLVSFAGLSGGTSTPGGCNVRYQTPAIATRTVGFGSTSGPAQTQVFTYSTVWDNTYPASWDSKTTTVSTTDNILSKSYNTTYTYGSVGTPSQPDSNTSSQLPVETSVTYYDWSNATTPLVTIKKTWLDAYEMSSQQQVFPNGQSSETVYCYSGAADVVTEKDEFDFGTAAPTFTQPTLTAPVAPTCGAGSPTRKTVYSLQNFGSRPTTPTNPDGSYSFSGEILDLPCKVTIYDNKGNLAGETDTYYDSVSTRCAAASSQNVLGVTNLPPGTHDETAFAWRGNPTRIDRLSAAGVSASSTLTYDETGQVRSLTDPCGNGSCTDMAGTQHTTTFSYSDNFYGGQPSNNTNAYLTSVVRPSANGIAQQSSYSYVYTTGAVHSATDPNSNTTTYAYVDALNRLTSITYPPDVSNGNQMPQTSYAYTDTAPTPRITTTVSLGAAGASPSSTQIFDGMGHVTQTQTSDPAGPDLVSSSYDGEGHLYTSSNPYRSGDPQYQTSFLYDALGSPLSKTAPDSSITSWRYSGNTTIDTDETGRQWARSKDALGRLTTVVEPGIATTTPTVPTTYSYDANDNLLLVTQTGVAGETLRARSFTYDWLSRLLTSSNPETGPLCYGSTGGAPPTLTNCLGGYDLNGNLQAKTDARGIQTMYSYDVLNRITGKSFRDGTPQASFSYDQTPSWNATPRLNTIGRLAYEMVGAAAIQRMYSYDTMGRVTELLDSSQSERAITYHTTTFHFDLAGRITDLWYPRVPGITRPHVQQSWDQAGHLTKVYTTDSGTESDYLQSATYYANGTPSSLGFGNGVVEQFTQNVRLQPLSITASNQLSLANNPLATGITGYALLSRAYSYASVDGLTTCGTAANNGNIFQIGDVLNSTMWTRKFGYDCLNRLTSSQIGSGLSSYWLDSFGNMSLKNGATPALGFNATNTVNNLPCAASLLPYDAAGNQVCDTDSNGANRVYAVDAEERPTSLAIQGSQSPFVTYAYDAEGSRGRKSSADGTWTEYQWTGGGVLSEKDQGGFWTDYVYANGEKIAKNVQQKALWHMHAVRDGSSVMTYGVEGQVLGVPATVPGVVITAGDMLTADFKQVGVPSGGGIALIFTNGTGSGALADANSGTLFFGNTVSDGSWHHMVGSLASYNGLVISYVLAGLHNTMPAGTNDTWIANVTIVRANGSVIPIFNGQSLSVTNYSGTQAGAYNLVSDTETVAPDPAIASSFFLCDHLGTTQLELSGGGWPIWSGQFSPYGQEITPASTNTTFKYKFTGKERDTETQLDYFGARYYANNMGRFMSPDWSYKEEPVPYSRLDYPQSLNLYSYVLNNPITAVDGDGHACIGDKELAACHAMTVAVSNGIEAGEALQAGRQALQPLSAMSENAIEQSQLSGSQASSYEGAVLKAGAANLINPNLLVGLAYKESSLNPAANLDGARGLYQIRGPRQKDLGLSDAEVTSVDAVVNPVAKYLSHSYSLLGGNIDLTIGSWRQGISGISRLNSRGTAAMRGLVIEPESRYRQAQTLGENYIDVVKSFF